MSGPMDLILILWVQPCHLSGIFFIFSVGSISQSRIGKFSYWFTSTMIVHCIVLHHWQFVDWNWPGASFGLVTRTRTPGAAGREAQRVGTRTWRAEQGEKNEQIPLFFPLRPSGPAAGTSPLLTSKVLLFILRQLGIISWRPCPRVRPTEEARYLAGTVTETLGDIQAVTAPGLQFQVGKAFKFRQWQVVPPVTVTRDSRQKSPQLSASASAAPQ